MRYAFSILLGLLIGTFPALHLKGQSLTVAGADSLRLRLRAGKADTSQVGTLLQLSAYYQRRTLHYARNLDTALTLANQAYALSGQLHDDKGQQEALFQQGKIFIRQEKLPIVKKMLSSVSAITRIRLLLELGENKLRPTYSQEANLDSALWYFGQADRLSQRLGSQLWQQESQLLTGVAYLLKGDCERSSVWFKRVIQARQWAGDKAGELKARLRWATAENCEFKYCKNSDSLSRAFVLARQLGDRPREALLLIITGNRQAVVEGNYKQAEREALKALAIQKAIGYPVLNRAYHELVEENDYLQPTFLANLLSVHSLLADIKQADRDVAKQAFYDLEAVRDLERNGFREDLDWPYFWLGNAYFETGQFARSLVYYQQSIDVSHRKGEVAVNAGIIRRMAESLTKEGKPRQAVTLLENFMRERLPLSYLDRMSIAVGFGQCYTALGEYKLAEQYFLEAVAWGRKDTDLAEPFAWRYISEFYVATAQQAKAAPYLKLWAASPGLMPPVEKLQLHLLQYKVDSAQANYSLALTYYQRYTALKDSLLNETTSKQMVEMDVKYQTRQKEQALKLRQKDITLLTQQRKTQQTLRNALICGTLLLAALLGLSYNRYRLKRRSNQLLQDQQQEISHKNENLQRLLAEQDRLLAEKERLLKEIHHRVKNNLQVVMSLLNSQANSLTDKAALSAIQESQHRVQAVALIHQKLYQNEGVSRIPMKDYIEEVVTYLEHFYDLPQPVHFQLAIDPIELDVTQAIPLGLIINEALTNALKYAFRDGRSGAISLSLRRSERSLLELTIEDDGAGFPADYNPSQSSSLGMTLMLGLSEQLGGALQVESHQGLTITLTFSKEPQQAMLSQTSYG